MTKILIIEDNPQNARLMQRVLEKAGFEVIHASAGLPGLKIATQQPVDIILLDMNLPDLSGHTIAALISRIPRDIPIVAVTASTDERTRHRAMSYGCDGYITKPIDTRLFAGQIGEYLNSNLIADDLLPEGSR